MSDATTVIELRLHVVVDVERATQAMLEFHAPDIGTLVENEVLSNLEDRKWVSSVESDVVECRLPEDVIARLR